MKTTISGKITRTSDEQLEEIIVSVESEDTDTSVDTAIAYNAAIEKLTEEEEE